ncbi:hypothetical protein M413DRAFT_297764 [Hebeloma cylindrosporum]|uniref:Uncharacterized protein n=1 Tax=Hebeloma cylindrosporum TaxID=76867 RepID=A0A0C2YY65_HEBCY|nr:hypothetical protein M413DRAFT_297764 [Hebeloma cylindrosporum h7]
MEYHQARRGNKDDGCQPKVREELVPRQNIESFLFALYRCSSHKSIMRLSYSISCYPMQLAIPIHAVTPRSL